MPTTIDRIEKEFLAAGWRTERKSHDGILMTRPLPAEIIRQCKEDDEGDEIQSRSKRIINAVSRWLKS